MKLLTEVTTNNHTQDAVIEHWTRAEKDEHGNIIYTDKKSSIGKVKGHVDSVIIYLKDENDYQRVRAITISGYSIKKLYQQITEIEAIEGEEFID